MGWISNRSGWEPSLYEAWFRWNPYQAALRAREQRAILGAVDRVAAPGHRVIEVGAGAGHYTLALARRCAEVLATDGSPAMLGYLDKRLAQERIENVRTAQADLPDVGAERVFDGALSVGVFNYLEDLGACLRGLRDVVKPGGWIVFTVPRDSFGGRIYRATEFIGRHRVWLHSRESAAEAARRSGLEVADQASAGFTRSGLTLVTLARVPDPSALARAATSSS